MTLRELVAVRVMGAKVITTIDPVPDGFYIRNGAPYYGNTAGRQRCECFMPDTSIADAWRVVEKINGPDGKGPFDCGSPFKRGDVREECWARFGGYFVKPSTADTMPLAICLAALRAVGVPDAEIEEARKAT